jgi:hypothetical protein
MGNYTRLGLRSRQIPADPLHKVAQTHQRRRVHPDRLGRDKANTNVQVPRLDPGYQAEVERACRDDQAESNSHSAHAKQLGQLHLGRPAARHAQTVRSHRAATDDVRVLYLVHRQPQRQEGRLHAQDARCPAQHPSKSSEKHMRRLQSDIEGCARRRDVSPSYRAADLEAQRGRHHPAVFV